MREKIFISYEKYGILINQLVEKIKRSEEYESIKYIYGVTRGGLPIAVHLSHYLGVPFLDQIIFLSKDNFTINSGNILIVDDICDTGRTLEKYKNFKTATLFYKKRASVIPDFYVEVVEKWQIFPWEIRDEIPNRKE